MPKSDFNVFEVLDITHEKYYSRVLAWLLDPSESHKQRGFFLKWFLKTCEVSQRTKYEKVTVEELIGGTKDDSRRIDIALRCEGYLIYIEVKIDNRSIDRLQPSEQYELGRKQSDGENRKFVHVFLTPDDTASELVEETETKHVTWGEVRDALRERVRTLFFKRYSLCPGHSQ
jgi:hypothetical protein